MNKTIDSITFEYESKYLTITNNEVESYIDISTDTDNEEKFPMNKKDWKRVRRTIDKLFKAQDKANNKAKIKTNTE
jgi:hypothetical protein